MYHSLIVNLLDYNVRYLKLSCYTVFLYLSTSSTCYTHNGLFAKEATSVSTV